MVLMGKPHGFNIDTKFAITIECIHFFQDASAAFPILPTTHATKRDRCLKKKGPKKMLQVFVVVLHFNSFHSSST